LRSSDRLLLCRVGPGILELPLVLRLDARAQRRFERALGQRVVGPIA
jgi:hypothetical protein